MSAWLFFVKGVEFGQPKQHGVSRFHCCQAGIIKVFRAAAGQVLAGAANPLPRPLHVQQRFWLNQVERWYEIIIQGSIR